MTIDATTCSLMQDEAGEILHGLRFAGLTNELAAALIAYVYRKPAQSKDWAVGS